LRPNTPRLGSFKGGIKPGGKMMANRQWRRLQKEYRRSVDMSKSAMRADVDRKTAQKHVKSGKTPEEHQSKHDWRTRPDPVETIRAEAERRLNLEPAFEANTLFEFLLEAKPGHIEEGHLRTFQRRVSA
jgi:hypothetical protein